MSTVTLPAPKDVRDMLAGLVGRNVTVSPGAPVTPTADKPVSVAVYVAPDMSINALCVMDLAASAYTAGGLALLPPGGCQDAVEEDGELSGMMVEALHEVGLLRGDLVQGVAAVLGLDDVVVVVTGLPQGADDDLPHDAAVVGDKDLHSDTPFGGKAVRGRASG